MGKGILDQDEPLPPAFRSGQQLPVKQRKGCKYEEEKGQKIVLHHVCDRIHSIQTREMRTEEPLMVQLVHQTACFIQEIKPRQDKFEEHLHRQTLSGIEG